MTFREARTEDVDDIVKMLANDKLGQMREDYSHPLPESYLRAFDEIQS